MSNTISLVRHRVGDFDAWKKVYDGFAPIQAEHGVLRDQVLRSTENPNDVIVTHAFDSREAARAFFEMPELKEAMSQAGVKQTLLRSPTTTRSKPARRSASSQSTAGPRPFAGRSPAHLRASPTAARGRRRMPPRGRPERAGSRR